MLENHDHNRNTTLASKLTLWFLVLFFTRFRSLSLRASALVCDTNRARMWIETLKVIAEPIGTIEIDQTLKKFIQFARSEDVARRKQLKRVA